MKTKLFLLFVGFSLLNFVYAQDNSKVIYWGINKQVETDQLCSDIQSQTRSKAIISVKHAEEAVDKILKPVGLKRDFVLVSCPDINNAMATRRNSGVRYIVYDNEFMKSITNESTDWANVYVLAHEVAHHLYDHTTNKLEKRIEDMTEIEYLDMLQLSRQDELICDEWAGFILAKLGATIEEALGGIKALSSDYDDTRSTHPTLQKRLSAIRTGYNKTNKPETKGSPKKKNDVKTAETYYLLGETARMEEKNTKGSVKLYSKAIELNSKFLFAYQARAYAYKSLGNYQKALQDWNMVIKLDPNNDSHYNSRSEIREELGDIKGTFSDLNNAIRLNPNDGVLYYNRALTSHSYLDYEGCYRDALKSISLGSKTADAFGYRSLCAEKLTNKTLDINSVKKRKEFIINGYDMAIKKDPSDGYWLTQRGVFKLKSRKLYNEAISDFRRGCALKEITACVYLERYK